MRYQFEQPNADGTQTSRHPSNPSCMRLLRRLGLRANAQCKIEISKEDWLALDQTNEQQI
jgi:hypothetical protein